MIYCYDLNTCGNCANPYSVQCSGSRYSTISRSCANGTLNQRYQLSKYSGVQFNNIAQWTIVATGSGYQQIVANSTANMMNRTALVGDILAFQGLSIAKEISTDSTEDYRCITPVVSGSTFTCTAGSLSSNSTQYRYLLQITIVQAIQIAPNTVYYNVGTFSVQGTLTQSGVTSVSASTILPVIYGIQWIEIVGPSSSSANVMMTFIANVYPASKYLSNHPNILEFSSSLDATATAYMWFINNNNTMNSSTNMLNISFPFIGTYIIGCQARNLLSMKYNSTTVNIQDTMTNMSLHAGNITNVSTSQPLEVARFQLRMLSGSNYACRVNYDTSQAATEWYYYTYGYIPGSYLTHRYINPGAYNVSQDKDNDFPSHSNRIN